MILSHATNDLLDALHGVLPGIRVAVVGAGGDAPGIHDVHGGVDDADRAGLLEEVVDPSLGEAELLERRLPGGETILIAVPGAAAAAMPFLAGLVDLLVQRDQLERDMDSMNQSSLQLLEQVAMLGETLPRLSAGASDEEIAATGLKACVVAAGVERALYLRLHPQTGLCEAQVFVENLGVEQAAVKPYPGDGFLAAGDGLLASVLAAADGVTFVQANEATATGEIERLARRDLLAVPVTYGAGDKRVCLGALVLFDKIPPDGGGFGSHALGSEEGQVALSFASMLGAVLGARQTAALGKELSMAQTIQAQILPDRPAVVAGFDLAGDYRTSGEVGGDYFDYVQLADGRTFVVVADVSGHNLASGMMMVGARATLRTLAAVRSEPSRVFDDLAASMFEDLTRTERFITAAGVALRAGDGTVEVVNAGHNDLLLFRAATRTVQRLPSRSTILGFLRDATYDVERVQLCSGDCLVLYTDGITEAMDADGTMFGDDRLAEVVANAAAAGRARDVVDAVLAAVRTFRGPYERGDDMTLVAIQALPQRRGGQ